MLQQLLYQKEMLAIQSVR